jgi:hypothetical protein
MRLQKLTNRSLLLVGISALLLFPACHVNVKKNADESEKKVDIDTPLGGIHVSKDADLRNIGLPIYPGAKAVEKEEEGHQKSADVNISTSFFGLKVAAQEFESSDGPDKLIQFYGDALKKYGPVLTCHHSWHHGADVNVNMGSDKSGKNSRTLTCNDESGGTTTELKVGTRENQHVVDVEPRGNGSRFALAHVEVHGGKGSI